MKNLLFALAVLLLISSCKKEKEAPKLSVEATISAITLGEENFVVAVPQEGTTTTITHAPFSIVSVASSLKVNITAAANTTIKMVTKHGIIPFVNGNNISFADNPITFIVTAQDGITVKSYGLAFAPYNKITNPYGVYTVKHLADIVNGYSSVFLLKNNIDLPNANAEGATATGISDYATAGWRPLSSTGSYDNNAIGFRGTLDGGGFSINNFYAKREEGSVGLFEKIESGGTIKNLTVKGVGGEDIAATGVSYAGILAGENSGTIENCKAEGNVSASTSASTAGGLVGQNKGKIRNSNATGNVSASTAGGLAGTNDTNGTIRNSYATGAVSSSSSYPYLGGLVGNSSGNISYSYATGAVSSSSGYLGGLVGYSSSGNISYSYATGAVSSSSTTSSYASCSVGGLVGYSSRVNISYSYATGAISSSSTSSFGSSSVGGLVGDIYEGNIYDSYADGNVTSTSASTSTSTVSVGGLVGRFSGSSSIWNSVGNCYAKGNISFTPSSSSSSAGGFVGNISSNGHISIRNSYAAGNIIPSGTASGSVGGFAGNGLGSYTDCYRNSAATTATPLADVSVTGIIPKTVEEMKKDEFKGFLNGIGGAAWGREDAKNGGFPYLIKVVVAK